MKATEGLKKENDKLKKVADEGAKRVKELGNVQNWAEMLERDFLVLEETLRLAKKSESGDSEGSWDTDESGSVTDDEERLRGIGIFGQRMGDWVDEGDGSSLGGESRGLDREGDTMMEDAVVDSGEHIGEDKDMDHLEEGKDMDHMDEGHDTEHLDKGKGKEIEPELAAAEQQSEDTGGSSTATTTTRSGSGSDPSSSSVHTAASAASATS